MAVGTVGTAHANPMEEGSRYLVESKGRPGIAGPEQRVWRSG